MALHPKYIQNLTISHNPHCHHLNSRPPHLSPGLLQQPHKHSLCFNPWLPAVYSQLSSQSDPVKHKPEQDIHLHQKAKLLVTYRALQDLDTTTCLTSPSTTPSQHPSCASTCQERSHLGEGLCACGALYPSVIPQTDTLLKSHLISEASPVTLSEIYHQHHPIFSIPLHCFIFPPETYHHLAYLSSPAECKLTKGKNFHVFYSTLYFSAYNNAYSRNSINTFE